MSLIAFQAEAAEQQKQVLRGGDLVAFDVGRARVHLRENAGSVVFIGGRVLVFRAAVAGGRGNRAVLRAVRNFAGGGLDRVGRLYHHVVELGKSLNTERDEGQKEQP